MVAARPPLSAATYLVRNQRRILPAFIMILFIVVVVVVVLSTMRGLKEGALRYTREFQVFTVVMPKKDVRITEEQKRGIRGHPGVDRVIESLNCIIRVRTLIGPLPYELRSVCHDDMLYLMDRTGLRLREGRLPEPGSNEVAIHEWILRANGWTIGQEFGLDVDDDDWMRGRFTVSGVLEGDVPMGFASYEYLSDQKMYQFAPKLWERQLVVPKRGEIREVNDFLRSLKGIKSLDALRAVEEVDQTFERILLVSHFVSAVLIIVVAVVIAMLNNLFFAQRMEEFALLMAVGWPRGRLVRKGVLESSAIAVLAWIAGVLAGWAVLLLFSRLVLEPLGIFIPTLQGVPVAVSAMLPLISMVISGLTIHRRLGRLDPVSIIERRG